MSYLTSGNRKFVAEDFPETVFRSARDVQARLASQSAALLEAFSPRRIDAPGERVSIPEVRALPFPTRGFPVVQAGLWIPPPGRDARGTEFELMRLRQRVPGSDGVGFIQFIVAAAAQLYQGKRQRDKAKSAAAQDAKLAAQLKRRNKKNAAGKLMDSEPGASSLFAGLPPWVLPLGAGIAGAVVLSTVLKNSRSSQSARARWR